MGGTFQTHHSRMAFCLCRARTWYHIECCFTGSGKPNCLRVALSRLINYALRCSNGDHFSDESRVVFVLLETDMRLDFGGLFEDIYYWRVMFAWRLDSCLAENRSQTREPDRESIATNDARSHLLEKNKR